MAASRRVLDCDTCAAAVSRTAFLAYHLRKLAARVHILEHHTGIWSRCDRESCRELLAVLEPAPARPPA